MIIFNGKSFRDFGCHVDELESLSRPEWDTTSVEVPGRNGTVTYSNGRFKNIELSYDCMIDKDFGLNYAGLLAFLQSDSSYHRMEADAEKETFRMARVKNITSLKVDQWFQRATFTVEFDCKPQRFLKSGEDPFRVQNGSSFYNQYLYPALPILRVYGWGTVRINGYELLLNEDTVDPYVDIDCDLRDAFYGKENRNSFLEVKSWPVLDPGENIVSLGENITKMEITPRWWTI